MKTVFHFYEKVVIVEVLAILYKLRYVPKQLWHGRKKTHRAASTQLSEYIKS